MFTKSTNYSIICRYMFNFMLLISLSVIPGAECVVDHYITERLHVWLSAFLFMLLRSALKLVPVWDEDQVSETLLRDDDDDDDDCDGDEGVY